MSEVRGEAICKDWRYDIGSRVDATCIGARVALCIIKYMYLYLIVPVNIKGTFRLIGSNPTIDMVSFGFFSLLCSSNSHSFSRFFQFLVFLESCDSSLQLSHS